MGEIEALLVAYADGLLDVERMRTVEALLATNPEAREKVRVFRETARLLRAAYREPARVTRPATRARRFGKVGWPAGIAIAACVLGFCAGVGWANWPGSPALEFVSEVAEYHGVYASEDKHLVEVPAEQMTELTQWLGARLGRPLTVPDLTREKLQFAGARMLVVSGQPVAQLMYTRAHGRAIALCITKLNGRPEPIEAKRFGDQTTAAWQDGNYAYVVVGEIDSNDISRIADDAAAQLKRS